MMRLWHKLLLCSSLAFSLAIHGPFSHVQAESDCGNGLTWRLQVDSTGWINREPPLQGVRVRQTPGGEQIGRINPGDTFQIVDGPECSDGISWWLITTDSVFGWIAEGTDGSYFVEPLSEDAAGSAPLVNEHPDCDESPPTQLKVGEFAEWTPDSPQVDSYYGDPRIAGGLFSLASYVSDLARDPIFPDSLAPEVAPKNSKVLLIDGPVCFNGGYVWQIAQVKEFATEYTPYYAHGAQLWVYGTNNGHTQLYPSPSETALSEEFEPVRVTLQRSTSAPQISPETQLAFLVPGGGGGYYTPELWVVPDCPVGDDIITIGIYFNTCMYLYPFKTGDNVNVSIFRPDGTLYSERSATAETITLGAEESPYWLSEFQGKSLEEAGWVVLETGAVRVDLPDDLGMESGNWRIEGRSADVTIDRSYQFLGPEFQQQKVPSVTEMCDGPHPLLTLTNFPTNQSLDIVLIEGTYTGDTVARNGSMWPAAQFREIERWNVPVGDHGDLLAHTDFIPPQGYLAVVDEGAAWQNEQRVDDVAIDSWTVNMLWGCPISNTPASPIPIGYGDLITGSTFENLPDEPNEAFYSFTASAGDIVDINMVDISDAFSIRQSELNPALRLESPEGEVIAENDNANQPKYGAFDAEIEDVTIPADGSYLIVASWNKSRNPFAIILDGHSASEGSRNKIVADAMVVTQ